MFFLYGKFLSLNLSWENRILLVIRSQVRENLQRNDCVGVVVISIFFVQFEVSLVTLRLLYHNLYAYMICSRYTYWRIEVFYVYFVFTYLFF